MTGNSRIVNSSNSQERDYSWIPNRTLPYDYPSYLRDQTNSRETGKGGGEGRGGKGEKKGKETKAQAS